MLETGRVGRVTGDRYVHTLFVHDGYAFAHVIRAVAAYFRTQTFRIRRFLDDVQFAGSVVEFSLDIGKTVDTRNDHRRIFAQTVQDHAQRLLAYFVGHFGDLDCAFGGGERFVPGQECETLRLFAQQAGSQVTVADTHFAVVGYRAGDAEGLQAFTDGLGSVGCVFTAFFDGDRGTGHIGPFGVFKADRLCLFAHFVRVDPLGLADGFSLFEVFDAVFGKRGVVLVDAALVTFK